MIARRNEKGEALANESITGCCCILLESLERVLIASVSLSVPVYWLKSSADGIQQVVKGLQPTSRGYGETRDGR
jgi:hypothetical protein